MDGVCHKGGMSSNLYSYMNQGKKFFASENKVKLPGNDHGQLIQGGSMEHLAHVIFGNQSLISIPKMQELSVWVWTLM